MGIDVYVGTLTRYHAGQWKSVAQQAAESRGMKLEQVDAQGRLVVKPDVDMASVRPVVDRWRKWLEANLGKQLKGGLDWDESDDRPYFTDKPGWWGYQGVLLLAAYREFSTFGWHLPEKMPDDLGADPAYAARPGRKRYSHLFDVTIWLPAQIDLTFRVKNVAGADMWFGSSDKLIEQLRELNRRTYKADGATLAQWRKGEGPDDLRQWSAEQMAKYGLAVFTELAERSATLRLPMLLDY